MRNTIHMHIAFPFFSLSSRFKMMFMEMEFFQQKKNKKQKRGERGKWYAWEKKEGNKRRKRANGRHEERRGKEVKEKR
jgi:hypothetical protein